MLRRAYLSIASLAYFKIAFQVVTHPKFSIFMIVHACRGGQNKTAKSSIDAILKLWALPMSRAGVYQLSGESCPRSNRDRLSVPRTGGEVGGPTPDHGRGGGCRRQWWP